MWSAQGSVAELGFEPGLRHLHLGLKARRPKRGESGLRMMPGQGAGGAGRRWQEGLMLCRVKRSKCGASVFKVLLVRGVTQTLEELGPNHIKSRGK